MSVPPKWRERLSGVREHMPPVTGRDGNPASRIDRQYAENIYAHSTVPPEHLDAVKGIRLTPARGSAFGSYDRSSRTIDIPTAAGEGLRHRSDAQSDRRILSNTVIHETGHGVDHRLNPVQFGTRSGGVGKAAAGRREAVAENYADRHTWPAQGFSTYDDAVHHHETSAKGHPTIRSTFGKSGVETYKDFRKLGLTPDDPIPSDEEVDRRLAQPFEPKLVDDATRKAHGKPVRKTPKREGLIG